MPWDLILAVVVLGVVVLAAVIVLAGMIEIFVSETDRDDWPRGTRWFHSGWEAARRKLGWLLLRIFYPERLPKKIPHQAKLELLDTRYRQLVDMGHDPVWVEGTGWCMPLDRTPGRRVET